MTTFDFSPFYRSSVGFDRLFNRLDSASRAGGSGSYPPYNIEVVDEDEYRITMAVAGFTRDDLTITSEPNSLVVKGAQAAEDKERRFLHRGIAQRTFEHRFQLADHVRVTGADLRDGLLHIELERVVPEAMKPQTIEIGSAEGNLLEGEADKQAA